jgi:DNA ligase-1
VIEPISTRTIADMRTWSETAEAVAATSRTSEKTRLLAGYLRSLDGDDLAIATVFFTGRPFAEADQRSMGLGWAAISAAVTRIAGASAGALGEAYGHSSDLGTAVAHVLGEAAKRDGIQRGPDDAPPSLHEAATAFASIEAASGAAAKGALFEALLRRSDPLAAKYLVKVLGGDLRIGLREGLVEAAIAAAFERPVADVQRASMLTGDIGETAVLARDARLGEARLRLFHPLRFMLASPGENATEILGRLGPSAWVEDKYDGIRAQLHRRGDVVRIFSRDLHDVSGQFPEIVAAARTLDWDGILDGEILAFRGGTVLPFLQLQQRLGRKSPPPKILSDVPVAYVACDILALGFGPRGAGGSRGAEDPGGAAPDVVPLLDEPLAERRARLEALGLADADPDHFALSYRVTVDTVEGLEAAFADARSRRNEGLMVKDPRSTYSPGRRGYGWMKMKKALATLDCAVVGVEVGHGKRHGVLSDYTFAVRDESSGDLVTIGKAYSGLTDAEIAEMTAWFEAHTIRQVGRYRLVEPTVVVEIAFDVIMRSSRHRSGFAMRFPRIARLRPDKSAAEIDTLATVESLYVGLQAGPEHLVTAAARRTGAI